MADLLECARATSSNAPAREPAVREVMGDVATMGGEVRYENDDDSVGVRFVFNGQTAQERALRERQFTDLVQELIRS